MRILCPMNRFYVHEGIIQGLEAAGCEILTLDGAPVQRPELIRGAEEFKPDVIFTYAWWEGHLRPEDLSWLGKNYHIPHAYWACDDPTHHRRISLPLARIADLVLTTTEELLPVYRAMGKKAAYLQHCCNPAIHRQVDPRLLVRHDVVLVAANYSQAQAMSHTFRTPSMRLIVEPLIRSGIDLKVFGDGWDDGSRPFHIPDVLAGPPIPYRQVAQVYASAKIVLGLQTECHWSTQTSCRPFEVLGCRAFHLAPATRAMRNLFIPGRHLVISHEPEETVALVRYYLEHDDERQRIAASGQEEVYGRHTCRHRAQEFMAAVQELI